MDRCPVPEVDSTGNYKLQQDSDGQSNHDEWDTQSLSTAKETEKNQNTGYDFYALENKKVAE